MKSERRHELQHNDLAEWLAASGEWLQQYQRLILMVVTLVILGVGGYFWWSRAAASQTASAWNYFHEGLESQNPDLLVKVAEDYPNTKVANLATVVAADYCLAIGCGKLPDNKALAQGTLNTAIDLYQADLERTPTPSLLVRATYGLGRAKESKGDLDQAAQCYREILDNVESKKWPDGAFVVAARQRLDEIEQYETKRMYDDFRKFESSSVTPDSVGTPSPRPNFDAPLPEEPSKMGVGTTPELGEPGKGGAKKK